METRGLLLIPDISGFTRFVNETDIEHSRLIIQELLEVIIDQNRIGLKVSEIEGDAILFYRFGEAPELQEVYTQVEAMFCAFHRNVMAYSERKYCQCKACIMASQLSLKVITHYGEFTGYNVHQFNKLIGKDIIVAHQLLKNEIPQHEYWLVTNNLIKDGSVPGFTEWMTWTRSAKQTEKGEVSFHFTQLGPLKENLSLDQLQVPDLSSKEKLGSASRMYDVDLITMFHACGDFNNRATWQEGVVSVEEVNHYLPRVGMRYKSVRKDGQSLICSTSFSFSDEEIIFTETEDISQRITQFHLKQISQSATNLTIACYADKKFLSLLAFNIFRRKQMEDQLKRSMAKLAIVANEIHLPE